jgi:hypothetical protein
MLPLQITNDMLTLIEQSSNQLHEKVANAWLFGKVEYTYFEGVAVVDGVEIVFNGDKKVSFTLKGIEMHQLYNNRKID